MKQKIFTKKDKEVLLKSLNLLIDKEQDTINRNDLYKKLQNL